MAGLDSKDDSFLNECRSDSLAARVERVMMPDSKRSFALKLGVSEGTVRRLLKGDTPKLSLVEAIAKLTGTDLYWLITGEHSQTISEPAHQYRVEKAQAYITIGYYSADQFSDKKDGLKFKSTWLSKRNLQVSDLTVVSANGDAMAPTIDNRNAILVDQSDLALKDGAIYVFRFGDELYAKRVQKRFDGSIALLSDNKEYSEQVVSAVEISKLLTIGKVVWISKSVD